MECLIGIAGKDFVILASDTMFSRSITVMKSTEDKTRVLSSRTALIYSGESGDTVQFAEFIQANVRLNGIKNGIELSPKQIAHFTRRELADSLRSRHSYQINMILGGFDMKTCKPHLYWIDYLAAMTELPYAAHGYAAYYCLSLLDRSYHPDINLEEGVDLLRSCIAELKRRFVANLPDFKVRVLDKDGIREIEL